MKKKLLLAMAVLGAAAWQGGKCVCLGTLRREWKEFQKGGGFHEGKDRYPNHLICPLSKKFS